MRVALALLVLLVPGTLDAHEVSHHGSTGTSVWDIAAVAILMTSGALYAAGQRRMAGQRAKVRAAERWAFWAGWAVMLAAVLPPLDQLSQIRFSAHMLQHELLMLVGAPLIVAGRPLPTWLWGLPPTPRRRAAAALRGTPVSGAWTVLTAPVVAWIVHGAVVWIWHAPALYEMAVSHEGIHAVQHAMFVGSSILFWWGLVYGRYGRAGYGASVLYVFTTAVHTGLLGALFTLTSRPLYGVYVDRAPDPLGDQQVAGLVMWIPAGVIFTLAGIGLFAAWLGASERRATKLTTAG